MELLTKEKKSIEYFKISDICDVIKGNTPTMKATPGDFPLVVTAEKRKSCDTYQINNESVCIPLVSSTGHGHASINRIHYQEGKFGLANIMAAVTPKDTTKIFTKYLYYLFNIKKEEYFVSSMIGTANVSLKIKDIEKVKIPLPSFKLQKTIVSKIEFILSEINAIKKILEENIELEKQYRQSSLQMAFEGKLTKKWRKLNPKKIESIKTNLQIIDKECEKSDFIIIPPNTLESLPESWEFIKIGRMVNFIGSGVTPRGGKSVYQEKGVPFIRSQNVYPDGLHLDKIVYVSKELHDKMSRTHIHDYDVLLNITGASIGRSTFIPNNFGSANVNQHVCILRGASKINPEFFSFWLNSPKCQKMIFSIQQGETREGLNYSMIRHMIFPLCSPQEQKEIVSRIHDGISLIKTIEKSTIMLEKQLDIFESNILQQLFE